MKKIITTFLCSLYVVIAAGQDIITQKDGVDIQAKVIEVGIDQISYKKYSNPDGPTYVISKSDILMITYENGEREMYNTYTETPKAPSLPQGVMTFNDWSGKISVGGVTIENEMLDMYFSPSDLELYKNGKTTNTVGLVIGCIGAVPVGWSLGYYLAGGVGEDQKQKSLLIGGGIALISGMVLNAIGYHEIKTAVSNYNHSSLAFQPELRLVATNTDIGIGLALVF